MDHGHMDHGGMGHGGMNHGGDQCQMNMLFTWSTNNLCIVFSWWKVTGPLSLIFSLVGVAALTAGYEGVRQISRSYEQAHNSRMTAFGDRPSNGDLESSHGRNVSLSLLVGRDSKDAAEKKGTFIKAFLYAVQVFYSFFIMLLFMTYNGGVMLAVAVGAFFGYLIFGSNLSAAKSVACH